MLGSAMLIDLLLLGVFLIALVVIGIMICQLRKPPRH
jgi:hypothetical protein